MKSRCSRYQKIQEGNLMYRQLAKRHRHSPLYLSRNLNFRFWTAADECEKENAGNNKRSRRCNPANGSLESGPKKQPEFPAFTENSCSQITFSLDGIELIQLATYVMSETCFRSCECQITLYEMEKTFMGSIVSSRLLCKHVLKIAKNFVNPVELAFIPLQGTKGPNSNYFCYKLYVLISKPVTVSTRHPLRRTLTSLNTSQLSGSRSHGKTVSANSATAFEDDELDSAGSASIETSCSSNAETKTCYLFSEIDLYNSKYAELLPNGYYELALNPIGSFTATEQSQLESEYLLSFNFRVREASITALEWRHRHLGWNTNPMLCYHFGWSGAGDCYELHVIPGLSCLWCKRMYTKQEDLILHLNHHHSFYEYVFKENSSRDGFQILVSVRSSVEQDFDEIKSRGLVPKNFTFTSWNSQLRQQSSCNLIVADCEVKKEEPLLKQSSVVKKKGRKTAATAADSNNYTGSKASSSATAEAAKVYSPQELYDKFHKHKEYFHSKSFRTIQKNELEYDSDNEIDADWISNRAEMYIDDFSDLDQYEKTLMKIWNKHIMKFRPLGYCHLSEACISFTRDHGKRLMQPVQLRSTFVSHLMFLTKCRLITHRCLMQCIQIMDDEACDFSVYV